MLIALSEFFFIYLILHISVTEKYLYIISSQAQALNC